MDDTEIGAKTAKNAVSQKQDGNARGFSAWGIAVREVLY